MPLPDDVDPRDLDQEARRQLTTLSKDTADLVAQHLVVAGRLMDEDPVAALAHARAARAMGGRVGVVREANGLVAYAAGEWAEALSELRTARRITGQPDHLPVMADCERALGRPDRALLVAEDPQASALDAAGKVELLIVSAGARRDMGQVDAAVVSLQVGALEGAVRPWTSRLRYAYADALLEAGRTVEARAWFSRTAEADPSGETDAVDRLLELDGYALPELDELGEDDDEAGHLPDAGHGAAATLAAALSSWAERDAAGGQSASPTGVAAGLPPGADTTQSQVKVTAPASLEVGRGGEPGAGRDAQAGMGGESGAGRDAQVNVDEEPGQAAPDGPVVGDDLQSAVPQSTVPQSAVPQSTVPQSTVPQSTVPQSVGDAAPAGAAGPLFQAAVAAPDVPEEPVEPEVTSTRPNVPVVVFEAGPDAPELRLFE